MFQPTPGGQLGAYTILDEIARGGQGVVFRARLATGELLALKVLSSTVRAEVKRFQQEAQILARLAHPNLPRVHGFGEAQGTCFLALELIQGRDLGTVVEQAGPLPLSSAALALAPIAEALDYCHRQGVIHRDVKPSNIVIEEGTRRPVLIDFGMVRRDSEQFELSLDHRTAFSLSGTIRGTPEFMAPEQVDERRFGAVSAATDVYGLGATLYYLLSGACPATGEFEQVIDAVTERPPPNPREVNPACPGSGAKLSQRAMAKDQAARPPTPLAFARELRVLARLSIVAQAEGSFGAAVPASALTPGTRLGSYEVVSELGRGAKGVVLLAHDEASEPVALKVLAAASGHDLKRLAREGEVLAALQHENIVGLLDVIATPVPCLVIEYVEGQDLQVEYRQRSPVPWRELRGLFRDIAAGLAHSHACGVAHRDLKPANVLVRASGQALLTDFNLAVGEDTDRFTQTGTLLGTPVYMSPEQAGGQQVERPSDVWSLGMMLYEGLTGALPFESPNLVALRAEIMRADFPRPRSPKEKLPPWLETLCMRCLHKDPAQRPSAAEVRDALSAKESSQRSTGKIFALALVLPLLLLAGALVIAGQFEASATSPPLHGSPSPEASLASAAPSPAATQPAPPAQGWTLRWRLSESAGSPPVLARPDQWTEPGRAADPLRPVRLASSGQDLDCFWGEAQSLGAGRVAVRYSSEALALEATRPSGYFETGVPEPIASDTPERLLRLRAPNDSSPWQARLGAAHWGAVEVKFGIRRLGPGDIESFRLQLASDHDPPLVLGLDNRAQRLSLGGVSGSPPHGVFQIPAQGETHLSFSPGAPPGQRLLLGGRVQAEHEPFLEQPPASGPIEIGFSELDYGLSRLQVTGRPTRPGRPALAEVLPEPDLGAQAEIRARFRGAGVPFVQLGGARLSLEGSELILREGRRVLLRVPCRAETQAGELRLQRVADRLLGTLLATGGDTSWELWRPLPEGAEAARVAYGASSGQVSFDEVEVFGGEEDPLRARYDACADLVQAERLLREEAPTPRTRWWLGSLLLARISDPTRADLGAVGQSPDALRRRRATAQEAVSLLENNEAGVEGRDRDALARGVWAAAIGGRSESAIGFADRLAREHPEHGTAALDALCLLRGRPMLLTCLSEGLVNVRLPQVPEAAFLALMQLNTDLRLEGLVGLAGHLRAVHSPRVAEGLPLLEEALAKGYEPASRAHLAYADILTDLKRYEEAVTRWEICAKEQPHYWRIWLRRAQCLANMGRMAEAVESNLIAVASSRHPLAQRNLAQQLQWLRRENHPGLISVGALVLSRLDAKNKAKLQVDAELIARSAGGRSDREGALAAYVLFALEATPLPELPAAELPEAVLARARAQHPPSRTQLAALAKENNLIDALATLDGDLRPLVR